MIAKTDTYRHHVFWRLLLTDYVTPRNATKTITRRHSCCYGSALPLTGDVVRLVGVQRGLV
jgi:hypothetical protein